MSILNQIRETLPTSWKIFVNRYIRLPHRYLTSRWRPLPDFVIAGGQKCGTTSMYNYLRKHPNALPALGQEVHYFDRNADRSLNWYRAHFPLKNSTELITGESTPDYLYTPDAGDKLGEIQPDAKIIFLLRNPVDRALSHYHHEVRKNREDRTFKEAVETELSVLEDADFNSVSVINRNKYPDELFTGYVGRGLYRLHLDSWFQSFDENQRLVIQSEAFFSSPESETERVFRFLGISPDESISFRQYNPGGYEDTIDSTLRNQLRSFYEPYNKVLFEWLGESYDWD